MKTYKQIAAENGTDWRTQIDDMAEVLEYAAEKGIDLGGVIFDGKLQQESEGEGEDEKPALTEEEGGDPKEDDGSEPEPEDDEPAKGRGNKGT